MQKEFTLSNQMVIPAVGFGTWLVKDDNGKKIIRDAIDAGYRYFDTASFYKNEEALGEAIATCGVPRDELMIASKIWLTELGYNECKEAFANSLKRLNTDYLDVYLIHWPRRNSYEKGWEKLIQDTWKAMEELYKEGKTKAIGLSNFLPHHIDVIMETATVKPMIDQLELHPGYMQTYAVEYCKQNGIAVQAWSPLGRAEVLKSDFICNLAKEYNVSAAHLILAFLNQQGIAVIPKSSSADRMKDNFDIYDIEISKRDVSMLTCLPQLGYSGEHPDLDNKVPT